MKPLEQLGQNIRELRATKEISQDRLAEVAGIDRSYMGMIERGESSPTVIPLLKIARALGCSAGDLLAGVTLEDSDDAT